jgi:hypothetical protein
VRTVCRGSIADAREAGLVVAVVGIDHLDGLESRLEN